ncbi:hypothetical protein EB796_005492 [Bugula neritina]|uniref:EGF-like domain-containing protein n=1 Tax=Bugula neritina TaxID=10212 RepID=A0A7J7KC48_BUGNE|nr:hypothetical protein EB796_005492 [Bugula neritina]
MNSILLFGVVCMVLSQVAAWCPPHTSIRTSPIRGLDFPRALHQSCCQGRGNSCGCGAGLQCCPNTDIRFMCVEDPCDPNPCGNGICATDGDGRRRCFCAVGTIQDSAGLCRSDPCFRNPCGRGGRCTALEGDRYTCRCSGGQIFNGKTCIANTCGKLRCGGSRCVIRGSTAVCDCAAGTRFDGRSCVAIDPCRIHSCGIGGHCKVVNNKANCQCRRGFAIDVNTNSCVPDNPCNRIFCGTGTCSRAGSRAVCNCDAGFRFDSRLQTCVSLNDPCRGVDCGGGSCITIRNQATCNCFEGFVLDARRNLCVFEAATTRPTIPTIPFTPTIAFTPTTPLPTRRGNNQPTAELGGRCTRTSCLCDHGFRFDTSTATCQVLNPCHAASSPDITQGVRSRARSGCLRSPNFPNNYPNDIFDEVAIPTLGFSTLTFVIQEMQQDHTLRDHFYSMNRKDLNIILSPDPNHDDDE